MKAQAMVLVLGLLLAGCMTSPGTSPVEPSPPSPPAVGTITQSEFEANFSLHPDGSLDLVLGPPVSIKDQRLENRQAYPLKATATIPTDGEPLEVQFTYFLDGAFRIARVDQTCTGSDCDRWNLNWRSQGGLPPFGILWDAPALKYSLAGHELHANATPWNDSWLVQLPTLREPAAFQDFEGLIQWDGKPVPVEFQGAASLFSKNQAILSGTRDSYTEGPELEPISPWPQPQTVGGNEELYPLLYQGSSIDHFKRGVTANEAFTYLQQAVPATFDYLDQGCVLRTSITPNNLSSAQLQGTQYLPNVENETQTYFRFTLGNESTSRTWEVIYSQDRFDEGNFQVYNASEAPHTFDCDLLGVGGDEISLDHFRAEVQESGIEVPHGVLAIRYSRFHDGIDLNTALGPGQYMFAYINQSLEDTGTDVLFPYTLKMRAATGLWEEMTIPPDQARQFDHRP